MASQNWVLKRPLVIYPIGLEVAVLAILTDLFGIKFEKPESVCGRNGAMQAAVSASILVAMKH